MKSEVSMPTWLALGFASLLLLVPADSLKAEKGTHSPPQTSSGSWTEGDWISWWNNIQDLYESGLSDEGLYWLLRHDLELLGQYEEILADIEMPPPYSGWSGGGNNPVDPDPPVDPYSMDNQDPRPMYGEMPSEWEGLILEHGLDPADFGGVGPIPAPPMWVAASISLAGTNLSQVPHPGTKVVGYVMVNVGGVMIIWVEVEDEGEDDSE